MFDHSPFFYYNKSENYTFLQTITPNEVDPLAYKKVKSILKFSCQVHFLAGTWGEVVQIVLFCLLSVSSGLMCNNGRLLTV